jgi:hypothetical protein
MLPFGIAEGAQLAALTTATGAGAAKAIAAVHKRTNLILMKLRTWTLYKSTACGYSYRKAMVGSIPAARRAGI